MLLGARQVGKSTLTRLLDLPHARYMTLDDAVTLSSAREDPIGFVASPGSRPLVIDELQRYPELVLEIKATQTPRPEHFTHLKNSGTGSVTVSAGASS